MLTRQISPAQAALSQHRFAKWADAYRRRAAAGQLSRHRLVGRPEADQREDGRLCRFGRSLKDDETAKAGLFQFPTVVGGVVPVVNVPGVKAGELTLSGIWRTGVGRIKGGTTRRSPR